MQKIFRNSTYLQWESLIDRASEIKFLKKEKKKLSKRSIRIKTHSVHSCIPFIPDPMAGRCNGRRRSPYSVKQHKGRRSEFGTITDYRQAQTSHS